MVSFSEFSGDEFCKFGEDSSRDKTGDDGREDSGFIFVDGKVVEENLNAGNKKESEKYEEQADLNGHHSGPRGFDGADSGCERRFFF